MANDNPYSIQPISKNIHDNYKEEMRKGKYYFQNSSDTSDKPQKKPKFLDAVILHYGSGGDEQDATKVRDKVKEFVEQINSKIKELDNANLYHGDIERCGSSSEGVKVGMPNEFDCILILDNNSINLNANDFHHVYPETFKQRKLVDGNLEASERSYYRISFKSDPSKRNKWDAQNLTKCKDCPPSENCTHSDRFLSPRRIQKHFALLVKAAVDNIYPNADVYVGTGGPAATIDWTIFLNMLLV